MTDSEIQKNLKRIATTALSVTYGVQPSSMEATAAKDAEIAVRDAAVNAFVDAMGQWLNDFQQNSLVLPVQKTEAETKTHTAQDLANTEGSPFVEWLQTKKATTLSSNNTIPDAVAQSFINTAKDLKGYESWGNGLPAKWFLDKVKEEIAKLTLPPEQGMGIG